MLVVANRPVVHVEDAGGMKLASEVVGKWSFHGRVPNSLSVSVIRSLASLAVVCQQICALPVAALADACSSATPFPAAVAGLLSLTLATAASLLDQLSETSVMT